ncbi:Predicted acetyltransferase involved in intracellular survival and related acetyltransferases [uncultured Roseburia sp.]|nr:Predicted acetyltransferase involved in intracellular survival and related acetyltransferases [uncultured Roseburia sp.]
MQQRYVERKDRETVLQMELRYLAQDEKHLSRELYEVCFPEDTEEFVNYYYEQKCKDNEILVLEEHEKVYAMIHLNPFTVSMNQNSCRVHYIVAVATDESCRRRGYMLELMNQAFHDLYGRKEPFTFLIPANPDYYYSCGFEYWESQLKLKQDQGDIWQGQKVAAAKKEDCRELALFSNEVLGNRFDLYVEKDEAYYQRLILEQKSQNGQIVVMRETSRENGRPEGAVSGIFGFDRECGVEIREPIMRTSCTEYVHPLMMGRIIHLESFCAAMKSREPVEINTEIRDTMIPENNGCYRIRIDENGGRAVRIHSHEPELSMDIAEIGQLLFHKMRIYINEIV